MAEQRPGMKSLNKDEDADHMKVREIHLFKK